MYLLASDARKIHAPRISSGSATVPFMISSFQLSKRWGNGAVSPSVTLLGHQDYG